MPLDILIQKVNQALQELGPVPLYNTTGITIAANQTEYSLPSTVRDVRRISYQSLDDSNDNRWIALDQSQWFIQPNATQGGADLLVFKYQMATDFDIKIDYVAEHPELNLYSDILYDAVPPELIVYPAIVMCYQYRRQRSGWLREWDADLRRFEQLAEKTRQSRSIRNVIQKRGKLVITGQRDYRVSEVDKARL